ncbi:MAG: GDSL-type esterase/lipase family protein [Pseudomonadota bacterium]
MIGVGLTEAESLTLSSEYTIENRGSASSGQAIRIAGADGTQGTATGAFTGPDGSYDIDVSYFNENDGEATFEVLVNNVVVATWTGAGGIQNLTRQTERVSLDLTNGDVITLRGTVGDGELARFDAIEITEVSDTGPVDPPPTTGATIGLGTTEAEDLDLVTYTVENRGSASGGQTIRMLEADGTQGTAAGAFTGAAGSYDIDVTYFNENDGEATFELLVNGVVAASWTGAGGTSGAVSAVESLTVDLAPGDIITLRGTVGDGELARFDKIEIAQAGGGGPVDPPPTADATFVIGTTEAEDLDLVTYTVENRGSASGGQTIRMLEPDGTQGTATGTFAGADGTYDLDITYFNENDGEATFELLVNGVVAASWTGAGGTSGAVSAVQSVTLDLETDDVITLRGTVGDGELARFDKVEITENDGSPVDPPAPSASIGAGTTEAETLDLETYAITNLASASGGQIIQTLGATGTQGTATGGFSGPDGNYNLTVTYLDESDGVGTYEVLVNDAVAFSWTGDGGSGGFGTPTEESGIVALQTGDVITIRGTVGDGEAVRLDKIELDVLPDSVIMAGLTEAEDLDIQSGYVVENRGNGSGGQAIRIQGDDGTQGTTAGTFVGATGNYTMVVTYFNENDGEATFEVLVNGVVAASWTGAGGTGGAVPETEEFTLNLATDDVITLRGTVGDGELARFDKIELTANAIDPGLPTFGLGATEAESLDLVTYEIANVATASGGQIVQIFDVDGTQGTASGIFTGAAGDYDLSVTYLDEIDGVGTYEVLVNDVVAFSWTGDAGGGGVGTPTVETGTVTLDVGDTITIRGTVGDGEAVRLDKIDILPAAPSPDTLDLSGTDTAHIVDLGNEFLAEAARLLLLGDSLTEGAATDGGYRAPLFERISHDLGLWVDFVGGRMTNGADGLIDPDHQGTGGITAATINGQINSIASNNPAEFALVMLGTNDALQESNPEATVPGDLLNIAQTLDAANASIKVLIGELPPTSRSEAVGEIPAINATLPGVVSDAITAGVDASLVDFSNITTADYYDQLHPDEDGVVKFADNWLSGLLAVSTVAGGTFDGTETALSTDITTVIGGSNNDRLTGDEAANDLDGQGGNDWLEGAGGNDILTGGNGTDLFVFEEAAGLDTITDFSLGNDVIDLRAHAGATDFAGLDITEVAGDAVIRVTGVSDADTITLTGVSAASLDADDFIFETVFV